MFASLHFCAANVFRLSLAEKFRHLLPPTTFFDQLHFWCIVSCLIQITKCFLKKHEIQSTLTIARNTAHNNQQILPCTVPKILYKPDMLLLAFTPLK